MIGGLRGKVARKDPGVLLVDVVGVLYEVHVSLQTFAGLPKKGASVDVDVVTHVRDDAIVLYGFLSGLEKETFGWLRGVNGVGPRLALNVLSGMPSNELREALAAGDVQRLCKIPGVGKRMAERLVLELKDRCSEAVGEVEVVAPVGVAAEEALSALVNLGYKRSEAERVVESLDPELSLEETIREALRRFAR
jgi:Holliday junction DNA helicase RuvA